MRNFVLSVVMSFLFLGADYVYADHHRPAHAKQIIKQTIKSNKHGRRSKQRAMQIAESRSGGKAVAIRLSEDGQMYRVRVLLTNGTVTHLLVSAYE